MLARFSTGHEGERLDRALTNIFPQFSRSFAAKLIDDGRVRIDGVVAEKSSQRVAAGQQVEVEVPPPVATDVVSQNLPLKILFERTLE